MRQRRVIPLLSLAGLALIHGCADSSAPRQATNELDRHPTHDEPVVVATHFESLPPIDLSLDPPPITLGIPLKPQSSDSRRLPPVYPTTESVSSLPASLGSTRTFERLPRVDTRPYAVDLTEQPPMARTPPVVRLASPTVATETISDEAAVRRVPRKRFVKAKPPKPPLPPLGRLSAGAPSGSAGWLMTGTSLLAVSQRADSMIDKGFLLAEKGAYYSARTELKQALRTISQSLDTHFGCNHYSEALAAGWLALEEADDFSAHSQRGPVVDVGLLVDSHQTSLLKEYALDDVSPVLAMQHYFSFAEAQLVEACGRAPVASRALHGLGKIHMVLAEKSASAERLHGPKAMTFQQAALATDPGNFLAANELGVLLARFGKLHEARAALQHSVTLRSLPESWENLSVVHKRLGEADLAAQSHANGQVALQQTGGTSPQQRDGQSMVQWVSPQSFAGQQPGEPAAPMSTESATPHEQSAQAKKKVGFLWW